MIACAGRLGCLLTAGSCGNWRPFYEAQFGVEIFVELYTLRFHHQSPPKCCKDTLPF